MKKLLALIVLVITALSCFACNSSQDGVTPSPSPSPSQGGQEENEYYDNMDYKKVVTEASFDVSIPPLMVSDTFFTLPEALADNAVYQRDCVFRIWGEAEEDGSIAVQIEGKSYFGEIKDGAFEVYLEPFSAGGPYEVVIRTPERKRTVKNVLFGDVYICSGQSNMELRMSAAANRRSKGGVDESGVTDAQHNAYYQQKINEASNQSLRLFNINAWLPGYQLGTYDEPMDKFSQTFAGNESNIPSWQTVSPVSVSLFSAVGYFFGLNLQQELDVPIGIMSAAVGDTILHCWAPPKEAQEMNDPYKGADASNSRRKASNFYNSLINPLKKFKAKGAVWLQGEGQPERYGERLTLLMEGWRRTFNRDLSFTIIQLTSWEGQNDAAWYSLREDQKKAAVNDVNKNATYSVAFDVRYLSDPADLNAEDTKAHCRIKEPVGQRAAYATLEAFYGDTRVLSGPRLVSAELIEAGKIEIAYGNIGAGLTLINGGEGFEVRVNNQWIKVNAQLKTGASDTLVLSFTGVATEVRYAYGAYPAYSVLNEGYKNMKFPAEQFVARLY